MADKNSIYCPSCHKHTSLITRAHYMIMGDQTRICEIGECNSCNFFMMTKRVNGEIVAIYPNPLPEPIDERVPESIREDFEEANLCFSVDAYRAAAVMARRTLQSICLDKGANEGDKLHQQIDWLFSQQIITRELKEWAHEVRYVGNDGAHPKKPEDDIPVTSEDAKDILDLLKQFSQVLYVAPAIAEERRKIRREKNKP